MLEGFPNLNELGRTALDPPGADRITFWDHSALQFTHLRAHTGLSISGTDLIVSGLTVSQFTSQAVSQWTNDAGYLTGFTEIDPVFGASAAASITGPDLSNWDAAFSWGNHASAGYLTSVPDATVSTKGIASFATADFNVASGAVELKDTVVKTITTPSGTLTPSSHGFTLQATASTGLSVSHSGTTISVAGVNATTSVKGVASFNSTNFSVSSGAVNTIQSIATSASPTFAGATLSGTTASRLLATNGSKALTSVADLTAWVAGTTNQISVANDGDGSITLSTPQNIHTAATPTFAGMTIGSLAGVLKAASGVVSGSATTSDLTEGSNLYFTSGRAITALTGQNVSIFTNDSGYITGVTYSNLGSSGARTEVFGDTADATGADGSAFGYGADANTESTAIGSGAQALNIVGAGFGSLAIGFNALTGLGSGCAIGNGAISDGFGSTAIGGGADAGGANSVAIGPSSIASAASTVAIGRAAESKAQGSVAIGDDSLVDTSSTGCLAIGNVATVANSATNSIVLGPAVRVHHNQCFVVGRFGSVTTATTAANQCILGTLGLALNDFFLGRGVTDSSAASAVTLNATGGSGTNNAGSDLTIAPGRSTGSATPRNVRIQGTTAGSSGTTAQTLADLLIIGNGQIEIEGALNHDGSTAGFLGATPAAQQAHVADPSGGSTVDSEARTAINSILATLETFGFHATS